MIKKLRDYESGEYDNDRQDRLHQLQLTEGFTKFCCSTPVDGFPYRTRTRPIGTNGNKRRHRGLKGVANSTRPKSTPNEIPQQTSEQIRAAFKLHQNNRKVLLSPTVYCCNNLLGLKKKD